MEEEIQLLNAAVDQFAAAMKAKLYAKAAQGYRGWNDPACARGIRASLIEHTARGPGQEVDVANLAMMLWWQARQEEQAQ